ncbi:hypothetical protein ACOMHN_061213 [Nucella lapillus]
MRVVKDVMTAVTDVPAVLLSDDTNVVSDVATVVVSDVNTLSGLTSPRLPGASSRLSWVTYRISRVMSRLSSVCDGCCE